VDFQNKNRPQDLGEPNRPKRASKLWTIEILNSKHNKKYSWKSAAANIPSQTLLDFARSTISFHFHFPSSAADLSLLKMPALSLVTHKL
jgi:hypothetical protein